MSKTNIGRCLVKTEQAENTGSYHAGKRVGSELRNLFTVCMPRVEL